MDERISLHESFNLCDTRVDYISDDTIVQRAGNTIVFVSITTRKQSILTFDAGLSLDCYAVSGSSVTGPGIGQVVVALHGLDGSQLQIYSWPKKQKIATIKGDCLIYAGLSLTRDGKHLAALSKIGTGTLYYYSLQTLTRILSVPVTEDSTIISFNPFNGHQILTGHSKRLTIWTISPHTTFQQPTMIQYPIALDAINKLDRQLLCHCWVADSRLYMATRGGQILECVIPSSSSSSHTTTVTSPTNATSTAPTTPLPLLLAGIGIPLTTPATETTRTESGNTTTTTSTPDVSPLPVQVVVTRIPIISQGESRDDYHLSDERVAYHAQQQAHVTIPSKSSRRGHEKSPLHSPGTATSTGTGTSTTFANHLASPTAQPPPSIIDPITSPSSSTSLTKGALIYSMSVTRQHIVVGTDDGTLLWISRYNDQLMYFQHLEQSVGSGICCLTFSPSFASFITLTVRGHLRLLRLVGEMHAHRHTNDEPIFQTVTLGHFPVAVTLRSRKPVKYGMAVVPMPPTDLSVKNARVVSYGSNGSLQLWCYGQRTLLANLMFRSSITCVTCSPDGCVAIVGLASGVIAVLDLTKANGNNTGGAGAVRLIFAQRFHAGPVVAIEFNKDGDVFATLGPKKLFFIRTGDLRVLGYVSHIHLHTSTSSDDDEEDLEVYVENANIDVDVMTLIWGGPADVSTGSHGHERLAIITKTGVVTVINAPNTFHEANELRLDPAFLAPVITTLSIPLVSCITALDDHNIIYAFNTEHQLCVYELNNDAVLIQKHIYRGHELQGTSIALSLNGQFMATTGMDGIIHIRPMHSLDHIEAMIPAHDYSQGGTHTVAFSPDSNYILSSGVDGGLFCWDISEIRGESQPRKLRMLPVAVSTKMLDASHEVEEPAASSPSFLERYVSTRTIAEKDLRQRQLRQELLTSLETFRSNYQAALARNETVPEMEKLPLTQFAIDLEARDRWLAESDAEVERVRSESIHTMLGKQLIATRIKQQCWDSMEIVGHQITAFKSELEVSNFPLRILTNQEQAMIRKIAHLRKMEIIERRWRYNQSLRTDDEVDRNFHPNKFTEEVPYIMNVDDGLYVPSETSRINAGNLTARKPVGKSTTTVTTTTTSTTSTGLSKDARDQPKDEVSLSQDLPKFLLYHPLDCITATRKRSQASLLAVKIDSMKRTFNEQFMEFYMQKQREIDHIHEKAKRITEIQAELQLDHPIYRPSLSADEIPTSVLTVDDSEITAPKVLSREERELAAQRAALLASASAQQDDGPTRALDVMMGGTLESKRDLNLLEQELVREEWMNLPPEQMNEEQKLELARFEKKVKIIQAEQETRRKLLHTELSKLKSDVSDICRTFDNRLKNLIDTRVATQRELYQHELMIIKLMNALVVEEEYEMDEHHLTSSLAELNNIKVATSQAVTEFKKELDTYAKYVENVQLEEKAMDRQFRKEFTDAGEHLEYLYKLFKLRKLARGTTKKPTRRTERGDRTSISLSNINMMLKEEKERGTTPPHETSRPSSSGRPTILPPLQHRPGSSGEEGYEVKKKAARRLSRRSISLKDSRTDSRMGDDEGDGLNPFGEPSSTDGDTDAPKYMDLDPSEMPESLHLDIWIRFLDKRRAQIEKEWECKKTSTRLQEMNKHYQHLQHVDTAVSAQIKSLATQKVTLQQQRHIFQLNTEVMLKIMQGQVEIEESPVVTDLKACEMLERHIVESLNTVITKLGREKVDILRETTGSRTAINLLEWTRKKLDLEHKDAVDLTTELQLLRVTKSLQSLIKMGGHDNQKAAELKSLDRKMEFVKQAASEVSMGKKMKLLKVKKRIRMQHRENERLLETVAELESAVKERMQISAIRADGRVEDERAGRDRMKALVTRRKLVDLAKLQSEEIKFLRDQVESLRRRTFASFAVPQLSANPDEYNHPSPPERKTSSVIQRVPVKTDKHTVGAIIADARAQTR